MDKSGFRYYKKGYDIPTTVHYCKKCVVSNQLPRITFNSDGICSACQFSEKKDHEFDWEKRDKELQVLCDKHRRSDAAHEVRDSHLTREEAVALVRKYDGEFPQKFYGYFLDYWQISSKQFEDIVDSWRPNYLWNHDGSRWVLNS